MTKHDFKQIAFGLILNNMKLDPAKSEHFLNALAEDIANELEKAWKRKSEKMRFYVTEEKEDSDETTN